MSSRLIDTVKFDDFVKASHDIKDVTIPLVSAYLGTEESFTTSPIETKKGEFINSNSKPIFITAMKSAHVKGLSKFEAYVTKVVKANKRMIIDKNPVYELMSNFEDYDFNARNNMQPSSRIAIVNYIKNHAKTVDDIFQFFIKHYLGSQRVYMMPKNSSILRYYVEYIRLLEDSFGSFYGIDDEHYSINYKRLMEAGFDLSKFFISTNIEHTMFDPDEDNANLKKDEQLIKLDNFFYVGYRPSKAQIKLMTSIINMPADTNIAHLSEFLPSTTAHEDIKSKIDGKKADIKRLLKLVRKARADINKYEAMDKRAQSFMKQFHNIGRYHKISDDQFMKRNYMISASHIPDDTAFGDFQAYVDNH